MAVAPWIVSDELWELLEPLLPVKERRFRYPGRKRLPDRQALQGILFVLHTGVAWRHLPLELGFGGGSTRPHNWSETIHGATAIGTPPSLTTDADGVRHQRTGPCLIPKGALKSGTLRSPGGTGQ